MFDNRKLTILGFFFVIGLIYLSRLLYLQVIDDTFHALGSTNAIKKKTEVPLRGQVYDRNGKLLVANVEVYDMYVTPNKVKNIDTLNFCKLFGIDRPYFDSTLILAFQYNRNKPSLFLRQLSKSDYARVVDAMVNYPGFTFEQSFSRTYPAHTLANALGYIGEISKTAIEKQQTPYYQQGDYIGLSGLEKQYEMELRGTRGVKFTMVNVRGEEKGSYQNGKNDTLAIIGKNFYSTIDADIQQYADSLMKNKAGSIVAIEPSTGEILAFGSYPTYDPNALSGRQFSKFFRSLSLDPDHPLVNRPLTGFYRPGSTFKLVQSLVALQDQAVNPFTALGCAGAPVHCHGHNPLHYQNMHNAIVHSCNPYFYTVFRQIINMNDSNPFKAAKIGMEKWTPMVAKFGYGQYLGIDLPGETRGILPNNKLYDKVYGENQWKFSNIYSISIGEGEIAVSMLKLANVSAAIANRGYWITPHLIRGLGKVGLGVKPDLLKKHDLGIDPKYFDIVVGGMADVVEGGGTAHASNLPGVTICGKTGTSQNKKGGDNAIFICFAPRDNPKIAVAVMVENAGFGASSAAPVASLLIEKYLFRTVKRKEIETRIKNLNVKTLAARNAGGVTDPDAEGSYVEDELTTNAKEDENPEQTKGLKVDLKKKKASSSKSKHKENTSSPNIKK